MQAPKDLRTANLDICSKQSNAHTHRQGTDKAEARQRQGTGKAQARHRKGTGKAQVRHRQGTGKHKQEMHVTAPLGGEIPLPSFGREGVLTSP